MRFALRFGIAIALLWAAAPAWALEQYFNQAREFPNYFLPQEYRDLPPEQVPSAVVAKERALLEKALGSVFERLVVPIVPEGQAEVRLVRYFPYMRERLRVVDPGLKFYTSGGVVRSALSYVYNEIYTRIAEDPTQSPERILADIASAREDLPAIRVRGVGSDIDLLVTSTVGKLGALQETAQAITDSAAQAFGESLQKGSIKNALFTMGDVRDYERQTKRSTRQGGSTIDYLAFDLTSEKSEYQKLVDPERFPKVVDEFIRGEYEFAAPETPDSLEDKADTTIRGARTMLELPWLKLKEEKTFRAMLTELKRSAASSQELSGRAIGEFAKGIRNSRYFGAHNRFYRSPKGSVEGEVLEIAQILGKRREVLLPEFADVSPISKRKGDHSELNGIPESLLIPVDDFIRKQTNNGTVFHGTPSLENALAIIRQGLFLSKDGQGTAANGRGVYFSPEHSVSEGYAGKNGLIFELKIRRDHRVNILDWAKASRNPAIQAIDRKANAANRPVFEVLSREHGIDIILNGHVLIENSDAVELPHGMQSILLPMLTRFRNLKKMKNQDLMAFDEFKRLQTYASQVGEGLPVSEAEYRRVEIQVIEAQVSHGNGLMRKRGAEQLGLLPVEMQAIYFKKLMHDPEVDVRAALLEGIDWKSPPFPECEEALAEGLVDSESRMQSAALILLTKRPWVIQKQVLKHALTLLMSRSRRGAMTNPLLLKQYLDTVRDDPAFTEKFVRWDLKSRDLGVRAQGARMIGALPPDSAYELFALTSHDPDKDVYKAALKSVDWSHPPDPRMDAILAKMIDNPNDDVRELAQTALSRRPADVQKAARTASLEGQMKNGISYEMRGEALAPYIKPGAVDPDVLARFAEMALKNEYADIRQGGAAALAALPLTRALPLLKIVGRDPEWRVREAAIKSVQWNSLAEPDREALLAIFLLQHEFTDGELRTHYDQASSDSKKRILASLLQDLSDPKWGTERPSEFIRKRVVPEKTLISPRERARWGKLMVTGSDFALHWGAVDFVGPEVFGTPEGNAFFREALNDRVFTLVKAETLKKGDPDQVVELLSSLFKEPDHSWNLDFVEPFLTSEFCGARPKCLPMLTELAQWHDSKTRSKALELLGEMPWVEAQSVWPRLLRSPNQDTAAHAAKKIAAFAKDGQPWAREFVRKLANDPTYDKSLRKMLVTGIPDAHVRVHNRCAIWILNTLGVLK